MEKIITDGKRFIDEQGRERIFSGVNLCDKGEYDSAENVRKYTRSYNDSMFRELAARGINIIRLGTTWDAIEHEPGVYDDEYLNDLRGIIDCCEKYGIYVFLDMHQDLYSGYGSGAGDGAPDWATMTDGHKVRNKPLIVWAEGYFWGKGVQAAYENFWQNKGCRGKGLLDYYAAMWNHVAQKLGDHPALFGFDMLNEPFPGKDGGKVFRKLVGKAISVTLTDKRIKKGKLIKDAVRGNLQNVFDQFNGEVIKTIASAGSKLIEKFDNERYTPFLNKTSTAIREATDNGILFVDNCYYSNLSIPCHAGPITVNGKRDEKTCFSPHGYDFMVDTPLYQYAGNSRIDAIFGEHANTQSRLNVPVVVGEWGGLGEGTGWLPHVHHLLEFFDDHKWSQTYWAFYEALLDNPIMEQLRRPYPRAVTGTIESYRHDRKENTFSLVFNQDREYFTPTVVFLPNEPKAVSCSGEYKIKLNEFGGCVLEMFTTVGRQELKVEL